MTTQTVPAAHAPWTSNFHIVLPDRARRRLLLLPSDSGWTLPLLTFETMVWVGESHRIVDALHKKLGLQGNFTVLRYLDMELNQEERWTRVLLVLELHEQPLSPPLDGSWVDQALLSEHSLMDQSMGDLLLDYLEEQTSPETPSLRAPWAQPGWFATASAWMAESLMALGRPPTGTVQQFRNLGISSILRVPTAAGIVYCKATADLPLFVNEAVVTRALTRRFPGQVPTPLAIDPAKRLMLLDDFGPSLRDEKAENADIAAFLRQFCTMQTDTANHIDDLLREGFIDRRLPVLAEQIDALAWHPLTARYLEPHDLVQLQTLAPAFKGRCAAVARYDLPATLVHGDLHVGNVARAKHGYLVFDWSDPCVAHPFMDMIVAYFFVADPADCAQVRDAYLDGWQAWAPMDRLLAVWQLAKPLAALHQAVSYLYILIGQEELVHGEMAAGLKEFVAFAISSYAEDDAVAPNNPSLSAPQI